MASKLALTLAVAACALLAGPVWAGPGTARFARLSVEDGLSQSSVEHMLQDRLGFLWFGTQEGLSRYDGYRFIVHRARQEPGFLRDHNITALTQDRQGDLWIGTEQGLHRLDLATGRIDRDAGDAAGQIGIQDVIEDAAGRIWFGTSGSGLWVLEPGAGGRRRARQVQSDALPKSASVRTLARANEGSIWAVASGRLVRVEHQGEVRVTEVLRDLGDVWVVAADPSGRIWIGARETDLARYDPGNGRVDRFPQAPRGILALLPAKTGELWLGARGGGLSRLDPETGAIESYRHDPDDPKSVSKDDVAALHLDRFGKLWIGCWNGGVSMLDPYAQAFRTFRHRPGIPGSLPDDDVTAMTEAPDGRLWLGSRKGVLAVGDARTGRFAPAAQLRLRGRLDALGADESAVLVGTEGGMMAFDPRSGKEIALPDALRAARLQERPITAIRPGPDGDLWIASRQNAFRLSKRAGSGRDVTRFDLPLSSPATTLHLGPNRRLWIGSETGELVVGEPSGEGLAFRRLEVRTADGAADSLAAHGFISSLHEDDAGLLWVGTRRGLGRIDASKGTASWLGEGRGLPSTNVAGVLADSNGFVWVATNRGLTRIDPKTGAMTHYGSPEGAQGTGYADRAYARGDHGLLYFAGTGVTAFDPREVRLDPLHPEIVFTGLEILRRPVEPRWLDPASPLVRAIHSTDAITLGSHASVFSVEMAALHYSDPKSVRFAYRLDGFDPDWIEADEQSRIATYTSLAPGDYVLRARARTKNGIWSEREATLAIHVLPPWWRTRSAIAGWSALSLLAAGMAWLEVRRRTRVRIALLERETLLRESLTDPLTGLYNRRFLTTYLQHEVPKALREYEAKGPSAGEAGADLLLLLIDVDHFKAINDHHSHAAGDRVLAGIAEVLREHVRDSDLVIRWGGDEFFIVSRSTHRGTAGRSVERLLRAVEAFGASQAAAGGPACTLSIGYAAFPFLVHDPKALTWEQTLEIADHALMLTKRRRRNSHTGLSAGPGVSAQAVVEFLSGGREAALPEGVEIVTGEAGGDS